MPTTDKPVRFQRYAMPDGTTIFEGVGRFQGYKRRLAGPRILKELREDFPNCIVNRVVIEVKPNFP